MKKTICYILFMALLIIALPLFIVRSCNPVEEKQEDLPPVNLQEGIKIQVFMSQEDRIEEFYLEEYIKGVVAAEMPADFGVEALKAQAIAARTYALGRIKGIYIPKEDIHSGAHVCTDFSHCQAWISKQDALEKWGESNGEKNWQKIEMAVSQTEGLIITYNDKIINPLYHSNSGGKTENSDEVWDGTGEPYLKSVISEGEEECPSYKTITQISVKDFSNILKKQFPNIELNQKDILSNIEVLEYTTGDRVNIIKIGNIEIKGTEFRQMFSLKSANFKIEIPIENVIQITTLGNGHGVGMSQWGANYISKSGGTYEEIIKHYYNGVKVEKIRNF